MAVGDHKLHAETGNYPLEMTEPPKVWVLEQFYRAVLLPHPSRKYLSCTLKEKEIFLDPQTIEFWGLL